MKIYVQYNEEILYSKPFQITIGDSIFNGHIYLNEKAELDQKQNFLSALLEIETKIREQQLMTGYCRADGKSFNSNMAVISVRMQQPAG